MIERGDGIATASARHRLGAGRLQAALWIAFTGGMAPSPDVVVGILGPLRVDVAGRRVEIGPRRERALIAALAARPGQVLSVDTLAEALWADHPPPNARKALQTYIARVRKRVGADLIETTDDGYRLRADIVEIDVVRLELLALSPEATSLNEALRLWRGEPLVDLADASWVVGERTRLAELRQKAEEDRIDALLADGDHDVAVADAEVAVAEEPLRERRWAQLMLALFRSGRQADALRAYQRCRTTLVDSLGIEPGPELRKLERAVLEHDSRLGAAGRSLGVTTLPPALAEAVVRPLVARDRELAELRARWKAVTSGDRATVIATGEPGVGKTRTVAEFAAEVLDQGGRMLYGRCVPDLALPFQPFAEALGSIPELGEAAADQYALFRDVRDRLAATATHAPLLVVVEDLHWATSPTLRLLSFLASSAELAQVMVLGTARPAVGGALPAGTVRLSITPLRVEDSTRLVELRSPEDAHDAAALHDLAGGNPFLLEQLLLERAAARRDGDVRPTRPVADVIEQRLARVTAHTRAVLELAALVGVEFGVDEVRRALDDDADALLAALDEAEREGLVVERGANASFAFCHALVRGLLIETTSASARLRHHRALAVALERRPPRLRDVTSLARHFAACASLGYAAQAVAYNREAGDAALRSLAFEDAVAFYTAALDAFALTADVDDAVWCDVLIGRGQARRRAGDALGSAELQQALDWARTNEDGRRFAAAVLALSRSGLPTDVSGADTMARLTEEALGLVGDAEPALRARLLAALAAELTYLPDAERRVTVSTEALRLARQLDDDELLARVLIGSLGAWAVPADLEGRQRKVDELVALAHRLGDDEVACRAHRELAVARLEAADLAGYRAALEEVRRRTTRLRQPVFDWELAYLEAADLQLAGDTAGAERTSAEALELGRRAGVNESSLVIVRGSLLGFLWWDTGRYGELTDLLQRGARLNPRSPFRYFMPLLLAGMGSADAARRDLAALAAHDFAEIPQRQTWPVSMTMVAEAAAALGDVALCDALFDRLASLSGRVITGETFRYTTADRVLGRLHLALGRVDDAARLLETAAAQSAALEAPLFTARVLVDQARVAVARGRQDEAERSLADAITVASSFGASGIVNAAERVAETLP